MCGICGFVGPEAGSPDDRKAVLSRMLEPLQFRGPDDEGRHVAADVALGMRRLAIIDVAGGQQPLRDEATGTTLVYNGELYNHRELRADLESRGHRFSTNSDTEVVLRAYLEFGRDFPRLLNGMFAAALWEPREGRLLLVRDHLGQKPLYLHQAGSTLIFASDLRSLMAHPKVPRDIDRRSFAEYLRNRHVPGPQTILQGVRQLPPASLLVREADGAIREERYWEPRFRPDEAMDLEGAAEEFRSLWPAAVRRHLISDVPVGAFLSGGIDSSLVTAEAAAASSAFRTFSISFQDRAFDETAQARQVADLFGCRHEVIPFEGTLESLLNESVRAYDQPFADPAAFPLLVLARETRRHVTVALTGDAADELFAGYQRYRSTLLGRPLTALPRPMRQITARALEGVAAMLPSSGAPRRWLDAVARRLSLVQDDVGAEYQRQFWTFDSELLSEVLVDDEPPEPLEMEAGDRDALLRAMLERDLQAWLPDQMLVKTDRATMAYSLEARLPFLDREVIDLALRIPVGHHLGARNLKQVLRLVAADMLPPALAGRRKHGFAVPVDRWLREEAGFCRDVLEDGLSTHATLVRPEPVRRIWREHHEETMNHGERLLALLSFFTWSRAADLARSKP